MIGCRCFSCENVAKFEGPVMVEQNSIPRNGLKCSNCKSEYPLSYIQNVLTLRIRHYVNLYYKREKKCGLCPLFL